MPPKAVTASQPSKGSTLTLEEWEHEPALALSALTDEEQLLRLPLAPFQSDGLPVFPAHWRVRMAIPKCRKSVLNNLLVSGELLSERGRR